MAVDAGSAPDICLEYYYFVDPSQPNTHPFEITSVTHNSIKSNCIVTTQGQYNEAMQLNEDKMPYPYVGLVASTSNYYVGTFDTSQDFETSKITYNAKSSGTKLEFPSSMKNGSSYRKTYEVTLSNSNKYSSSQTIKGNTQYFMYSYVLPLNDGLNNHIASNRINFRDVYTTWNDIYLFWNVGGGAFYQPSTGNGISIVTPPSPYSSVTFNQTDIESLKSLKDGQSQKIRYSVSIPSGDGKAVSNIYHYFRYKYDDDDVYTSWENPQKDSSNNLVANVVCRTGHSVTIQVARGNIDSLYSQTYYDGGSFMSGVSSTTISIPEVFETGELKKLETPEYRIEIWKSRLSDEAKYQFVDFLNNTGSQSSNDFYLDFQKNFNSLLYMHFDFELSFTGSSTPMAFFGINPYKNYGYTVGFKRISDTTKAVCVMIGNSSQTLENQTYHNFAARDDEKFKLSLDSDMDGKVKVYINDSLLFTSGNAGFSSNTKGVCLFNVQSSTGTILSGNTFIGKLYSMSGYDTEENVVKYNFIPSYEKSTSTPGLYDTVHQLFYPSKSYSNATTNLMKVGPNSIGTSYGMLVDISNLAVSTLNLTKERNLPDTLSVDIEYVQFKNKLEKENTKISDVLKPYLVDVIVRRNFEIIFSGILMYSKVTLQAVGKQTLTLQAIGYGEELSKRYINCSYGDMNYPQIARQIIYDAQHEMNWIDNYDFLKDQTDSSNENDTSYFNGWYASDTENVSYIPVKGSDTNVYQAHWQNGAIAFDAGCTLKCFKLTCSKLTGGDRWGTSGNYNQFLYLSFWHTTISETESRTITMKVEFDTDGEDASTHAKTFDISFTTQPSNTDAGSQWRKFEAYLNIGLLQGMVKHVTFTNTSKYDFRINDFNLYRPSDEEHRRNETNIAATTGYDLNLEVGYFDDAFNDKKLYSTDRVRHYHRQNAKEAIYNLAKLEDQNFEYQVNKDGQFIIKQAEGDLVVKNVATYPGQISEISIERDANTLYNVGCAINTHLYDNKDLFEQSGQSFIWADMTNGVAIDESSVSKYKARVQMVEVDTTTRREIEVEAQGAINASDEIQDIPTIKFDSNIYNPGNIHIGDAFGINVNIDEVFNFINGEYRVYAYSLRLSQDHVESMDITLAIPNALQLQLMTFPVTMKNMMNNIKRIQVKSNK